MLLRLGVFPVRRGEADAEALETARQILACDGVLVVFPEGTRIDEPDALGSPHHGAGRLALSSGSPIVPAAINARSRSRSPLSGSGDWRRARAAARCRAYSVSSSRASSAAGGVAGRCCRRCVRDDAPERPAPCLGTAHS